jgi:phosphoglycerate dehydrogenase-like enzyme
MKLLLTGVYQYTNYEIKQLESLGYDITFVQDERIPLNKQFIPINVSEIDAVVCNSLFLYNDIKDFSNLKFIQLTSAGMDRVPIEYIKENDIIILNARGVYSIPMAEWAVLKILEIYKHSLYFYNNQREKKWIKKRDVFELTNKTVSIIGFGSVGKEIAKRLKAFDMKVIAVDIQSCISDYVDETISISNIEVALRSSDIVILTLPLTHQTHHIIDKNKLAFMKDNCVLINISRGNIIDEEALIKSLEKGKFIGVALDVFRQEPLPLDNQLWNFENVIITPHNSFVSDEVNVRLFEIIYRQLKLNMKKRGI